MYPHLRTKFEQLKNENDDAIEKLKIVKLEKFLKPVKNISFEE